MLPLPAYYIRMMESTEQNPVFHAEGNVYIHTCAVLKQYQKYIAQHTLPEEEKTVLYWACVLHDIGKIDVTKWRENRWTSWNHEAAGVWHARNLLLQQADITPLQRKQILDLVQWHHVPLRWMKDKKPIEAYLKLATLTDIRRVGLFGWFDIEGRECVDKDIVKANAWAFNEEIVPEIESRIGTFEEIQSRYQSATLSHKNALWNAYKIKNPALFEKLLSASSPEPKPHAFECVMSVGAAKVGKTTYLQAHYPDAFHMTTQAWGLDAMEMPTAFALERSVATFQHHIEMYTRQHKQIVLDGSHLLPEIRQLLIEVIRTLNGKLTFLYFESTLETARTFNGQSPSPLAEENLVQSFKAQFPVHPWEAHTLSYIQI